jgi:hypothetical protein
MDIRPPPPGMDPTVGDWVCGKCANWNWARRAVCNRCESPRSLQQRPPPGMGAARVDDAPMRYVPQPHEDFGYVVPKDVKLAPGAEGRIVAIQAQAGWERRPKGTAGSGEKRTGNAGGFMEFDREAEDDRRKRRAVEEKQIAAERKAVRQKCPFCKRASCIC